MRELQCIATEVLQEPSSLPDLLVVQDFTKQNAPAISDDKLRALLTDQAQNFALIFTITEAPLVALLRIRSKIKDATVHIQREAVHCQWLHLFNVDATSLPVLSILTSKVGQHHPRFSESGDSCPLLRQILRRLLVSPATGFPVHAILTFYVSPSVNDPPLSTSAGNNGLASVRNVIQLRSIRRVVGRTDLVKDDGEFTPIPLRSPPIHHFLHHERH